MQKNYYAIIPANVRYDDTLTPNAKLLYGEITALCNERGYCWASNNYFAELYNKNKSTIAKWIKQLEEKNYIIREVVYKENSHEVESRNIWISNPILKNEHRGSKKQNDPPLKNEYTPVLENEPYNNTGFNNTFNNTDNNNNHNSINNNNSAENPFTFYQENFGLISPFISENIQAWCDQLSDTLVVEAMKKALVANKPFKYAEGVMKKWYRTNIRTLSDVEADEKSFERKSKSREEIKREIGGTSYRQ